MSNDKFIETKGWATRLLPPLRKISQSKTLQHRIRHRGNLASLSPMIPAA